jgi:hypothetical protein
VLDVMEGGSGFPELPSSQPIAGEPARRLGNGVIQRAVVNVLSTNDRPMRGADIHRAVEHMLGYPVSKNSVSWCLAACVRGQNPRLEGLSYGVYRLKR